MDSGNPTVLHMRSVYQHVEATFFSPNDSLGGGIRSSSDGLLGGRRFPGQHGLRIGTAPAGAIDSGSNASANGRAFPIAVSGSAYTDTVRHS